MISQVNWNVYTMRCSLLIWKSQSQVSPVACLQNKALLRPINGFQSDFGLILTQ